MIIKNYEELVEVGGKAVEVVLKLFDEGIRRADPYTTILEKVRIEDHVLSIHDVKVDLRDIERIVIVGAGKASGRMAEAIEGILKDRISDGIVLVPREEARRLKHIVLWGSDHPIPSERGVEGARRIVDTVSKLSEHDLVIVLLSGGASALMPLPYSNIGIDDLRELTEQLLKCGADIREVNAVRKHISMIKG
ncbi:MAG: glycerate kinase, partial [Thermoprotei archaeon]